MKALNYYFFLGRHFNFLFKILFLLTLICNYSTIQAADTLDVGFRSSWQYASGAGGNKEVTAEKPESKLWWHDDRWWASMWSNSGSAYHIFYLDLSTQDWIDTGVQLDPRIDTKADALLDGDTLYVVSHVWAESGASVSAGNRGQLFRYVYDANNQAWTQTLGGPGNEVEVNQAEGESLVIAKDSAGILWVTYVRNSQVYVNHTLTSDADWATPFVLPVGGPASVSSDDVSGIIAFNNRVGIMWSDQSGGLTTYFAVHEDGAAANLWNSVVAYGISTDDHINLKSLACDSDGTLYAALKTGSSPIIMMLRCPGNLDCLVESNWESYVVFNSAGSNSPTRPQLVVDVANNNVYVFVRYREDGSNGDIFYKVSSTDNVNFSDPIPFIQSDEDAKINDPTTTKQCVDNTTGIVVLASDAQSRRYFHNVIELGPAEPEPDISVSPSTFNFGNVVVGSSAMQTFTVRNNGTITLDVISANITGSDNDQFAIENGGGSFSLEFGETHDIEVSFNPTSTGEKSAVLRIASNDPDENPFDVSLSGTGENLSPDITVTPSSHDYGDVANGSSASQTFTVRNDGMEDLEVNATNLTGSDAGEFSIDSGGGSFTLSPSEMRDIDVSFNPISLGSKNAALRIESNDPDEDPFDVDLTGNSIPPPEPEITVSPDSIGFGPVVVPTVKSSVSALRTMYVINQGGATLNVTATDLTGGDAAEFSIESGGAPFSVAPNDTQEVVIGFTPATLGEKSTTLQIDSDDADEATITVPVTGTGVDFIAEVTFEESQSGAGSGVSSISTAGNLAAISGHFYIAAIASKNYVEADAVTGLGLTWAKLRSQCSGRNQTGVEIWWALGDVTAAGPVTATFPSAPGNSVIIVNRYSGANADDPIGSIISGNTNGLDGACDGGSDNAAYSFDITTLIDGTKVFGAAAMRNRSHTPGAGFQERAEVLQGSGGGAASLAVMDSTVDAASTLAVNGTFSGNVDWAAVGVAIQPGAGSSPVPKIVVTPASFDFEAVEIGSSATTTFVVSNDSTGDLNISDFALSGSDAGEFNIDSGGDAVTLSPGQTHDVVVSFNPGTVGEKTALLDISSDDPNNSTVNVSLTGEGIEPLQTFSMPLLNGWNLVGLPYIPADPHFQVLFPNAPENGLFGYNGSYFSEDSLSMCAGYWLLSNTAEVAEINGAAINECTIDLSEGWNLISGISGDVALENISDPDGVVIPGSLFGFDGSYVPADTVKQGKGYWINSNGTGSITLGLSTKADQSLAKAFGQLPGLSQFPTIEIRDAAAESQPQKLYYNVALDRPEDKASYRLPPISPAGTFDARFASDYRISEGTESTIRIKTQHYPVTLSITNVPLEAGAQYTITELLGNQYGISYTLQENQTIIISDPRVNTLKLSKLTRSIPTEFALFQNYPNPFNPTTEIRYSLPVNEKVELAIYNALGQKIKTLLNTRQEAGFHSIAWDGTNNRGKAVSSGIYLYRINAGMFSAIKKMILLK